MQKLYCYVDEAGQDAGSEFFVVVAIVNHNDQETLRKRLTDVEELAQTNHLKWHKISYPRRIQYLSLILEQKIAKGSVFTAHYQKPIPYFFPMLEILEKSIKAVAQKPYRASVYVDGIDRYKAKQLTNALRATGLSLRGVKSKRDESEPLIRLADMWAGCIRNAYLGLDAKELFERAKTQNYLFEIGT